MSTTTLGDRYQLLAKAGNGGTSSVFRARDLQTSRIVAIKILEIDRPFDVVRFGREATLLASVRHPNVVEYIAHGVEGGTHYLVQDWVDGVTLGAWLATAGASAREAVSVAYRVACALEATHARGVVHRDIKPSNIILAGGDPERVRVVDFGIARLTNDAGVLTRTGMLVGTPSYMSPEQARGELAITAPADVWSLGCVLFEALTGRPPFAGKTLAAIRMKVLLAELPDLAVLCPEAPPALIDLVYEMLDKSAGGRPANGGALVARLDALPPIAEGPRRRFGVPEPVTVAAATSPRGAPPRSARTAPSAFVMYNALASPSAPFVDHSDRLIEIAARHRMDVHVFDDGSAVFASRRQGDPAAIDAVHTAIAVQRDVGDGAVSVFGKSKGEASLDEAIDRGSVMLERATMRSLFGQVVDDAEAGIVVDDTIAESIDGAIPFVRTRNGAELLGAPRR